MFVTSCFMCRHNPQSNKRGTSIHICMYSHFAIKTTANTDPQCQHYKHHLRRGHWEKYKAKHILVLLGMPWKNRRMESVDLTAVSDWAQTSKQIFKQAAFVWSTRRTGLFVKSRPHFVIVVFYRFVFVLICIYFSIPIFLVKWKQGGILWIWFVTINFKFCICMNLYFHLYLYLFGKVEEVQQISKSAGFDPLCNWSLIVSAPVLSHFW